MMRAASSMKRKGIDNARYVASSGGGQRQSRAGSGGSGESGTS